MSHNTIEQETEMNEYNADEWTDINEQSEVKKDWKESKRQRQDNRRQERQMKRKFD